MSAEADALGKAMRKEPISGREIAMALKAIEAIITEMGGYVSDPRNQTHLAQAIASLRRAQILTNQGVL